jgi:hypothetical protein
MPAGTGISTWYVEQVAENDFFRNLLKNAQVQGARNPEK